MKPEKVLIKWVQKARQWCRTEISYEEKTGKKIQIQKWYDTEKEAQEGK